MKFKIDESNEEERIDCFLAELYPEISRAKIQKQIKSGFCKVNKNTIKPSYILKFGDEVDFVFSEIQEQNKPLAENIPLKIVWEDENMAVVNKPSGMLTHPTVNENNNTLVNALLYHYGENLSDINGDFRRGIVHRLDRNTSGLIMIAKNNKTHEFLVQEMKNRAFCKKYIAIVKGIIIEDTFEINSPIGRHLTQPQKQCVRNDGKESLTIVKVLKRFEEATLVELTLITGRTHQIRVHLSSIGHPVYNDTLYGFVKMNVKTEEQLIQSYKLDFTKPFSNERIHLEILPDEKFSKVFGYLK